MQRKWAVSRSAVTRVAMGQDVAARSSAVPIETVSGESGAELKAGCRRGVPNGKQNRKQNDNEVCLGIEAMRLRDQKGAQSRTTASERPVGVETGTQIAEMSGRADVAGARDATAAMAPACALGIFGGLDLGIVQTTSFSSRTIGRGAPAVCMDVPVIGAGLAGDVEQSGAARSGPGRTSCRSYRRVAVRATFLRTVPGRSRAGHAAAGARAAARARDAADSHVRMPNDFKEARLIVLDVVEM
ncbi:hypothetical protein NDN92_06660 [Burkholderia glumae]|uniref:hypothetical protein n=1 Tax=Burkholderia glumae TaxID=337 RepID=UPI0005D9BC15|nr:hypothetical protein [Burkholderia glumae]AJY66881.1 hypothetical protein KS03_316 [Burkholderia glumae LMG 2196 = ATCC 33617]MCM2482447.1 hypothetical protein [Burkholderia glumae]MCM2507409.1 hypothetical protein [Burkholderia glumae]MCM2539112.1 hypothetical protein [Burkholderia glumae]MCM2548672.1 hypothetical protein [Burkholderia glumae]